MNSKRDATRPKTVAIIPARIGSEEVHAKVLTNLGSKTVIEHVFDRVVESNVFDEILIAADHKEIIDVALGFGAQTFLTSGDHICGTDRCAEAAREVFPDADIVVNVQADEPFLNPQMIPLVVGPLTDDNDWDMTTLCCSSPEGLNRESPFTVKIVRSPDGRAIYFSRSMIPFPRYKQNTPCTQHIGIYAYRMPQLQQFAQSGPSALEMAEGLEQLRALELEMRIKVIETQLDYPRVSIDTQDDIDRAQELVSDMQSENGVTP
jgi:3-deoxy-manno-octulosonate cytidylyltransferase (CMP-KDO synthetase)